jgi:hypothetical protein
MLKFSAFGMFINRGEYGDQLPRFIKKVGHFCIGNTATGCVGQASRLSLTLDPSPFSCFFD